MRAFYSVTGDISNNLCFARVELIQSRLSEKAVKALENKVLYEYV